MSGQNLMHFLHPEMDRTFRDGDPYRCHAAILAKWDGQNLSDRLFGQNEFFDALKECEGISDCYFSINSFYCEKRTTANIRHLNAFIIDYDYYKISDFKDISPENMYELIKPTLPVEPTAVIDSGRGLYCIFALDHCSYHMTELYRHVYKNLISNQIQFGADPKATLVTQVIRIPGSINSRSGKSVRVIEANENRYKLPDLAKMLLPFTQEESKKYNEKKRRSVVKKATSRSSFSLEKDFKSLISMRNEAGISDGYREQLLYLYWEALLWSDYSEKAIQKRVLIMNDLFSCPLDQNQLLKQCKPTRKYEHRSSYQTIIRKLGITEDEMRKLIVLVSDRERKRRSAKSRRRTVRGRTHKKEALKQRREGVLKNLGKLKISEIADLFGVSKKTILRDLEYITQHLAQFQQCLQRIWKLSFSVFTVEDFAQLVINLSADTSWHGIPEVWMRKGRWCFM